MKRILHVVPETPPALNGLGDYARMLHRHWPEPRPEWHVAALKVPDGAKEAWPGVTFHAFEPGADSLAEILRSSGCETVAMHYVPHGYHPKGVPSWLPTGLDLWKETGGSRLITFFHELFAFSQPWRSAFWLAPSSIRVLRRVVALSDAALTSNALYARQLQAYGGLRFPAEVLPIGSNIGATSRSGEIDTGPWRVAVFGTAKTRWQALEWHRSTLATLKSQKQLAELVLIGASGDGRDAEVAQRYAAVRRVNDATESEVSQALGECQLGLVATDEPRVFKSGVFAAYCAHGVVPIVVGVQGSGPYLPVSAHQVEAALRSIDRQETRLELQDRVRAHARISDWRAIGETWVRVVK